MNYQTIKSSADLKLDGITIEAEWRDKVLSALTLSDTKGGVIRVVIENYSVRALIPAKPEKKKMHIVTGNVKTLGTAVREEFQESYEATARRDELADSEVVENLSVAVEEIDVPF